jgi:hypothetical protein
MPVHEPALSRVPASLRTIAAWLLVGLIAVVPVPGIENVLLRLTEHMDHR